nr:TrmH family RNA methyltransferase [Lachnospiraceae bacterium]
GISENILKDSDNCVIIPMDNGVDSLNVAAASAVAFWGIFKGGV